MDLFFFLTKLLVFLFLAIDLRQQLQGARFLGPQLQHILQRLARVRIGMIVDVLPRQPVPVFDLLLAAPVLDLALQRQSGGVVGLDLQRFLQFLQGQRIFLFFKTGAGRIQQLGERLAADGIVELAAKRAECRRPCGLRLRVSPRISPAN